MEEGAGSGGMAPCSRSLTTIPLASEMDSSDMLQIWISFFVGVENGCRYAAFFGNVSLEVRGDGADWGG